MIERPPEAQLIYEAREAQGLSQLAAAKAAAISDTYWRMVESGERVLTGKRGLRTLAKMAYAAGVEPGALAAAGRDDIESALAQLRVAEARTIGQAKAEAGRMVAVLPDLSDVQRAALEEKVTEVIREMRENG